MTYRARARAVLMEELSEAAKVDLGDLSDATVLYEEVPIDSLTLLQVFLKVEERLGIEIDETALSQVRTVGDLVDCITASPGAGPEP
jgi:acyl carrier protein